MHQGELLKNVIKSKGLTANYISAALNIHRNTITNKFNKEVLPADFLIKVGNLINYDFSQEIPFLKNTEAKATCNDTANIIAQIQDNTAYSPQTLATCEKELFILQRKYIALLEEHNKLISK